MSRQGVVKRSQHDYTLMLVDEDTARHSTSIRLDADTRARLDAIARRDDRSLAYVIKKAITEYLEREERKKQWQ
jgi:hypothetical protein